MKNRFDTSDYVRGLTIAGLARAQSAADSANAASRADLAAAEQRLGRQITDACDALHAGLARLRRCVLIAAAALAIAMIALAIVG